MSKFITLVLSIFFFINTSAQEDTTEQLRIFLDCNRCDNTYLKQNLGNVQFVRDQDLSDVHLFFVT